MEEVGRLAEQIRIAIPRTISGTLRFWGVWFGKPYDNRHTVVNCESEHDILRLSFDGGEVLSVWSPRYLTVSPSKFRASGVPTHPTIKSTLRISDADRVRWEWFYYGRPKSAKNLYFEEFVKSAEGITVSTNIDWYTPTYSPKSTEAAVEILGVG